MELNQIRQNNIFDVDNGLMLRMRVKRFFIDENGEDSVIIGSTTSLMEMETACPVSLLEGVPITEEILQELGFEWEFSSALWVYDGIYIINNGKLGFEAILTHSDYSLTLPVPYIHTLQNIYFTLKQKELPVRTAHFDTEAPQNKRTYCEEDTAFLER